MDLLKAPEPLQLTGNLATNWKRFKQKLDLFLQATSSKEHPRTEAAKAALLLSVAGDDALDVFNTFKFDADESKEDYGTVVHKFEIYCSQVSNEVYERYLFRSRKQADGEPFEKFLRDLKKQAAQCNFGELQDSMIRDQIVFGTNNAKLREKMLQEKNLTLSKAENMCKTAEVAAQQNQQWIKTDGNVDAIKKNATPRVRRTERSVEKQNRCKKCNRLHKPTECPAYGKKCNICRRLNHFAVCCFRRGGMPQVSEVCNSTHDDDDFDVLDVGIGSRNGKDWRVKAQVAGREVAFKIDTGSQANLLPFSMYQKLGDKEQLKPTGCELRAYNGGVIRNLGITPLEVVVGGAAATVTFFVVKRGQAILGLEASESLGLVRRTVGTVNFALQYEAIRDMKHVFKGLGCLKNRTA